jgi:hypothetical protein
MKRSFRTLGALALVANALPDLAKAGPLPFAPGERITWSVSYGGVTAGTAWAEVRAAGGSLVTLAAGARSASWYEAIYAIDDVVESLWDTAGGGSSRYRTRFREGRFHQDQLMEIAASGIRVWRKQERDGVWEEKVENYPGASGPVEDPQTAFYRIRTLPLEAGSSWRFPVFSGKKTWILDVSVDDRESLHTALGPLEAWPVHIRTRHEGDLVQKGDISVWLSDDARRIPVRIVIHANVGAIRADVATMSPAR